MWRSVLSDDYRIRLEFLDIDLQRADPSRGPSGDQLTVYDGSDHEKEYFQMDPHFKIGTPLYSRVNDLTVHFKTDQRGSRRGFKAQFQKVRRGSTCSYMHSLVNLVGNDGHGTMYLESPDFGGVGLYFPYLECIWNITVPADKRIRLDFLSPVETKDQQDFLSVVENNRTIYNITGYVEHPKTLISQSNHLQVRLTTLFFHRRSGFYAQAQLVDPKQSPPILTNIEKRVLGLNTIQPTTTPPPIGPFNLFSLIMANPNILAQNPQLLELFKHTRFRF